MALLQKQQIACAKPTPAARKSVARVVVCKASKTNGDVEVVSVIASVPARVTRAGSGGFPSSMPRKRRRCRGVC